MIQKKVKLWSVWGLVDTHVTREIDSSKDKRSMNCMAYHINEKPENSLLDLRDLKSGKNWEL